MRLQKLNPRIYGQLIFDKDAKISQQGKGNDSLHKTGVLAIEYSYIKNFSSGPYHIPCIKMNSRWITDLAVRPGIIKLPGETTGENLSEFEFGKRFLRHDTKTTSQLLIWLSLKLTSFARQKTPLRKWKDKSPSGRKYLLITYMTKNLHPEYRNSSCNSIRRQSRQTKSDQKTWWTFY